MVVRPAGELRLALRSERRLSEGGRLDLGFLGPWAPRVAASTASHESVEITIELDDAEIRVLSSVAEILGQQYLESEQHPEKARALESCLEALCRPAAKDGSLVYTAKVIAAVPVIRVRFGSARTKALSLGVASSAFELNRLRATAPRTTSGAKKSSTWRRCSSPRNPRSSERQPATGSATLRRGAAWSGSFASSVFARSPAAISPL